MQRSLLFVALTMVLSPASDARAGDRGLYLAFVDARGWETLDPQRDMLEHLLFECGAEELSTCRETRHASSNHSTGAHPVYAIASAEVEVAAVERAARNLAGRRELRDALHERHAIDGVVLYRRAANGRVTLVLINLNRLEVSRVSFPGGGAITDAQRTRALGFLSRGWVP